jgi:hypothetical protein
MFTKAYFVGLFCRDYMIKKITMFFHVYWADMAINRHTHTNRALMCGSCLIVTLAKPNTLGPTWWFTPEVVALRKKKIVKMLFLAITAPRLGDLYGSLSLLPRQV